jgi:hypothetical protein
MYPRMKVSKECFPKTCPVSRMAQMMGGMGGGAGAVPGAAPGAAPPSIEGLLQA